jgi:hypothetical protein
VGERIAELEGRHRWPIVGAPPDAHAGLIRRRNLLDIGTAIKLIAAALVAGVALVVLAGVHASVAIAIAAVVLIAALVEFAHAAFELVDSERGPR